MFHIQLHTNEPARVCPYSHDPCSTPGPVTSPTKDENTMVEVSLDVDPRYC